MLVPCLDQLRNCFIDYRYNWFLQFSILLNNIDEDNCTSFICRRTYLIKSMPLKLLKYELVA